MKFVDEAVITVRSGDGGRGCLSFRREKYVPRGGPDGGDGGKGGDVAIRASDHRRTLYRFRFRRIFRAPNGAPGQGKKRTGKDGADIVVEIPPGTLVTDLETGRLIKDFSIPGDRLVVARGGRGGKGNTHFRSATHRTPRFAQPGEPGEERRLHLELKLLADVGLVGLPNAGKSTLISAISAARPKIADYPFTTLTPNLGVVAAGDDAFVVADIPGLIEGAHTGVGLGITFLKHVERTRLLVHLIDAAALDPDHPLFAHTSINQELAAYSEALARKPQVVVLNKMDLPEAAANADRFEAAFGDAAVHRISAVTRTGLDRLMTDLFRMLEKMNDAEPETPL